MALLDSYSESNKSNADNLQLNADNVNRWDMGGQSFTTPNDAESYTLDSCKFYLSKYGSPTGTIRAKLYSHSGTYGTSSVGDTLLATSDDFDISTLSASYPSFALETFTFSGAQKYEMDSNTNYVIVVSAENTGDANHFVQLGYDNSSGTHGGNYCNKATGYAWKIQNAAWDIPFYVYGTASGTILDSYAETNVNDETNLEITGAFDAVGQSFTTPNDGISYSLNSCKFYLKYSSAPTGNLVAKLFAHTGTYGSGGVATGTALATSATVDSSTLGASMSLITFTFDGSYTLSPNTNYVIAVDGASITGTVKVGSDSTSPTHSGNGMYYAGSWTADTRDVSFYVYGTATASFIPKVTIY